MSTMDIVGPILAFWVAYGSVFAIWRWGLAGCWDRMRWLIDRLAHGPDRPVAVEARADHAEIARLERELGIADP